MTRTLSFNWPSATQTTHVTKQNQQTIILHTCTHNPQLHTRPATWKPQVCTSLLQMHALVHHFQIKSQPTNRIPDPQTETSDLHTAKIPTKNTNSRSSRHSTHLITKPDNIRHLILRTQIPPNLQINFYIFTLHYTTGSNRSWAQRGIPI